MSKCAIFVDHENIFFGLLNECGDIDLVPTPDQMAKTFKEAGSRYGLVKHAEAIADWEQSSLRGHVKAYIMNGFDIDYNITGKNNADLKISNEIRNLLEKEESNDIHTFILATGDGGYQPIIDTLLSKGKRVVVWGVKNCTSGLLQALASEYETIERLFDLKVPEVSKVRQDTSAQGLGGPSFVDNYTISTIEALIITFDELLCLHGIPSASYQHLMDHLAANHVCGDTAQEREFWFSRAVEEGYVIQDGSEVDADGKPKVTLNRNSTMVQKIQTVKAKLFKMLKDTLHHDFCPDFKRARDTMVNMIPGLHKSEAHTWLNWYIQNNIILTERRPHQQKPGAFFTVLRLNPDHPYVNASLQEWPVDEKVKLLVVLLDDFLTEKNVPWIAASTLLKILKAHYLREGFQGEDAWLEAKNLLNEALKMEIICKRNERDPMTGFETSQIFLNMDSDRVSSILSTKNLILKTLHESLRDRTVIAWSTFARELVEILPTEELKGEVEEWLELLVDQNLLLTKPLPGQEDVEKPIMSLTLNYANPVVTRKVKEFSGEDTGDGKGSASLSDGEGLSHEEQSSSASSSEEASNTTESTEI